MAKVSWMRSSAQQPEFDLARFFQGDGPRAVFLLGLERAGPARARFVREALEAPRVPVVKPSRDRVAVDLEDVGDLANAVASRGE